jgi:hypothetical protein
LLTNAIITLLDDLVDYIFLQNATICSSMDDWRIQQQQQQQKMTMNNIGPMHNFRSRPAYQYQQTSSALSVKTDSNSVSQKQS